VTTTSFTVPRIAGPAGAEAITRALRPADGVSDVVINVPARIVQVTYDEARTSDEALRTLIERAGYPVQRYSWGKR
jgi:copper chaperone CopZ